MSEVNKNLKLLYDKRSGAAEISLSVRSLDYLIAAGVIRTRRVGGRVLIPGNELRRFAQRDHIWPIRTRKPKEGKSDPSQQEGRGHSQFLYRKISSL